MAISLHHPYNQALSALTEKPPSLETLPQEIRNEIFKCLLLESKTMYPYQPHENKNRPLATGSLSFLAIMRVNKMLNQEAATILYAGAAFRLPTGYWFIKFFDRYTTTDLKLPPQSFSMIPSRYLIRQVCIKVVPQAVDPFLCSSIHTGFWKRENFASMGAYRLRDLFHSTGRSLTLRHWEYAFQILPRLQGLKHLIVNISMAYCTQGCCRLIEELRDIIQDYPFPQPDLRVTVQRQRRAGEVAKIQRAFVLGGQAVACSQTLIPTRGIDLQPQYNNPEDVKKRHKAEANAHEDGSEYDSEEVIAGDNDKTSRPKLKLWRRNGKGKK
ncbi:MAG: hypothetical protein Q9195_007975 [Heterodermia aff. obscurata]